MTPFLNCWMTCRSLKRFQLVTFEDPAIFFPREFENVYEDEGIQFRLVMRSTNKQDKKLLYSLVIWEKRLAKLRDKTFT